MLFPDYFFRKADVIVEIFRMLEEFIITDIANRILKTGKIAGTTDRNIWMLEQLGESKTEIMKKLEKHTKMSEKELKKILQDAVLTSWEDDLSTFKQLGIETESPFENKRFMDVIDAEWKKTRGELHNLTMTTIDQSQKDLLEMMNNADIRIVGGTTSYSTEICRILDEYAKKGLEINYPSGTKRTLESAVITCVVTSMNQTTAQLTNRYIIESGLQYVLVSAHYGARVKQKGQPELADHNNWQGKVYKIVGSEPGYPNLRESTGYDIDINTGAGTVVNPLGLHGYNCRHSHKAWDKSLKNPYEGDKKVDKEASKERYYKEQKMRRMERGIRKTKRELAIKEIEIKKVAETDVKEILQEQYDNLAYRLREQNKAYKEYCKENGFNVEYHRLKTAEFTKEMSYKANGRATKHANKEKDQYKHELEEKIRNSEINLKISKQEYDKHVFGSKKYREYYEAREKRGQTYQGRLLITYEEAQEVIDNFHLHGKVEYKGKYLEYVKCDKTIGEYYQDNQWHKTKKVAIHYGKNKTHIIPVEDKKVEDKSKNDGKE